MSDDDLVDAYENAVARAFGETEPLRSPMTPDPRTEEIRARLAAATPALWWWRNTTEPLLMGERSHLVMGFRRMGMNGAQPEFRNEHGLMDPAGKANINAYPDAALIANAPADLAYLLSRIEALEDVAAAVREAVDLRDETISTGGCEGVEWTADMSRRMAANLLRCRAALAALDGGERE